MCAIVKFGGNLSQSELSNTLPLNHRNSEIVNFCNDIGLLSDMGTTIYLERLATQNVRTHRRVYFSEISLELKHVTPK